MWVMRSPSQRMNRLMLGDVSSRGGFTLVELLVVIGIIALLVSILLPSLQKARASAVNLVCQTRLKQLVTAAMLYANDNRGILPFASQTQPEHDNGIDYGWNDWRDQIQPYVISTKLRTPGQHTEPGRSVFVCPVVDPRNPYTIDGFTDPTYPIASGNNYGIYGYHRSISPNASSMPAGYHWSGYIRITMLQSTQHKIILMDSQKGWTDLYPDKNFVTEWMGDAGDGTNQARHGTRKNPSFNVAFADGHVGSFLMSELGPRKYKAMDDALQDGGAESKRLHNSYFDPFLKL